MAIGLNTAQIIDRARNRGINLSESAAQSILDQAYDSAQYGADPGRVDSLLGSYGGGGRQVTSTSPQDFLREAVESAKSFFKEAEKIGTRSGEYEEKNPFVFDEALVRASSEEILDPYFYNELKDYLTGVNRKRERTMQDEREIRQELTTQTEEFIGDTRQQIDDALASSEEGFSGAGLFFSGRRERAGGRIGVEGEETLERGLRRSEKQMGQSFLRESRDLEDIASAEQRQRRLIDAERKTAIETDVLGERKRQLQEYELGRQLYTGQPGSSSLSLLL